MEVIYVKEDHSARDKGCGHSQGAVDRGQELSQFGGQD